jgi:hypothetical protein
VRLPILCTVYGRNCRSRLFGKSFSGKVALFVEVLRVSGCGLFFASLISVQRSIVNLGTARQEIRSIRYRFQREAQKTAMSEKKTIRIVKKGEKQVRPPTAKAKTNTARETARDMVDTVTNWVNEFQQRRRSETTNALRILSKTPRGSEA